MYLFNVEESKRETQKLFRRSRLKDVSSSNILSNLHYNSLHVLKRTKWNIPKNLYSEKSQELYAHCHIEDRSHKKAGKVKKWQEGWQKLHNPEKRIKIT